MSIAEGLSGIFEDPSLTNRANTWSQTQTVPTIHFTAIATETFTNGAYWQIYDGGLRLVVTDSYGAGAELLAVHTPAGNTIGFLQSAGIVCDSGLTVGSLPAESAPSIASGTVYQNATASYQTLTINSYATTAGTAGTTTYALGTTSTPGTISAQYVSGSTSSTATTPFVLRVPPQWYFSVTTSGTTIGTVTQIQE